MGRANCDTFSLVRTVSDIIISVPVVGRRLFGLVWSLSGLTTLSLLSLFAVSIYLGRTKLWCIPKQLVPILAGMITSNPCANKYLSLR